MITVLMGAPGAGKTTWLKANVKDAYIASTEGIRVNRDIDRNVYMTQMRMAAIKAAEAGKDLVCDGTHTITQHRLIWLNLAKRLGVKSKLVVFNTSLAKCVEAQYVRSHPAPIPIVKQHHARMNVAKRLIENEGWDEIVMVNRV